MRRPVVYSESTMLKFKILETAELENDPLNHLHLWSYLQYSQNTYWIYD